MSEYADLQDRLARGWNTWNTRSVLSHVLLPEGFALNLGLREFRGGAFLRDALVGRRGDNEEKVRPGPHAYDGSYTELSLTWAGIDACVQTCHDGDDGLVILVTPRHEHPRAPLLMVEAGFLWNRPGAVEQRADNALLARSPAREMAVYSTTPGIAEPYSPATSPYLALPLDGPVGISAGDRKGIEDIAAMVEASRQRHLSRLETYGDLGEVYAAMQTCVAWDTIYDPGKERVVTPVSRVWSCAAGGYVLFCWDTYFAAAMAGVDCPDLAYANAVEITREKTEDGFVPNFATATGFKSRDRSQPPVGAMVVRDLYRRYGDKWFVAEIFEDLLEWNRWWSRSRRTDEGLLCWGSDPCDVVVGNYWETTGVNDRFGAALESGLDNSPMYDDMPFDKESHRMLLADAGLTGMYVADCEALAELADALGRNAEAGELRERAKVSRDALRSLWSENHGIFLNRRLDTGELSPRTSPTNFYPLMADAATPEQARRMIGEHFDNPARFGGEWVMPSISREDPAYPDQDYWRGRIWAPMNYLVFLGLLHYDLPDARRDLAAKSVRLLLQEWRDKGHVHENYSADTGEGCDKGNSDAFYHWGGLLGLIALREGGCNY